VQDLATSLIDRDRTFTLARMRTNVGEMQRVGDGI
jgi:hypothetical protein